MELITRLQNLLLSPNTEWQAIKGEALNIAQLYGKYFLIYAALPAVGYVLSFLSTLTFANVTLAVCSYLVWLLTLNFSAAVVQRLAPAFNSATNANYTFKLVSFSVVPMLLVGALMFVPSLGLILSMIGSAYSAYLCYVGLPVVLQTPGDKLIPFTATILITVLVIYFAQIWLLGRIFGVALRPFY